MSRRRNAERLRPVLGAAGTALSVVVAVLLLVAAVYTAAQESRDIADTATDIQRVDVVRLRVTELEAARLLAESSDPALAPTAAQLRQQAIADLTDALDSGELPVGLASALDSYLANANDDVDGSGATAEIVTAIEQARRDAADRLDDSSGALDSLSILLVTVITYIVPALALMVFWVAVRQTRRLREAEAENRYQRQRNRLRDALIARRLDAAEHIANDGSSTEVVANIAETRAMIAALDSRSVGVPRKVSLAGLIDPMVGDHQSVSELPIDVHVGASDLDTIVRVDPTLVRRALSLITSSARHRSSERIWIEEAESPHGIDLIIAHDGDALTDAETRLVLDQVPLSEDGAIERGSDLLLLAYAVRLLEHAGASLRVERDGGTERVVVTLATAQRTLRSVDPEAIVDTPAAA